MILQSFYRENLRDGMDTIYNAKVDPKLYWLWYILNKNIEVRVKTPVGTTKYEEVAEIIRQGSGGGAIVSAANLDGAFKTSVISR